MASTLDTLRAFGRGARISPRRASVAMAFSLRWMGVTGRLAMGLDADKGAWLRIMCHGLGDQDDSLTQVSVAHAHRVRDETLMNHESKELKKAGLKVTLPRMRILEVLERAPLRHMSAEDVYKALMAAGDEIGLATVYRVLTQFESAGLVARHNFESGHAVFELDRGDHHDHIVCSDCGHVEEFVDESIERRQRDVAQRAGFVIEDHSLIIYGRCTRSACPHRLS